MAKLTVYVVDNQSSTRRHCDGSLHARNNYGLGLTLKPSTTPAKGS